MRTAGGPRRDAKGREVRKLQRVAVGMRRAPNIRRIDEEGAHKGPPYSRVMGSVHTAGRPLGVTLRGCAPGRTRNGGRQKGVGQGVAGAHSERGGDERG